MSFSKKRTLAHKHLDKKLRFRLRIYFVISLVLVSIVLYEIMAGIVTFPLAILGILIGIFLGFITARMFHLSWDENAKKIVSRLDVFGGVILVFYLIFALLRGKIVEYFIHGPAVGGVSLSIVTGIMIGRVFGTRGKIMKIFKEQHIFDN